MMVERHSKTAAVVTGVNPIAAELGGLLLMGSVPGLLEGLVGPGAVELPGGIFAHTTATQGGAVLSSLGAYTVAGCLPAGPDEEP
jgi:hypothetical protein